MMKSEILNPYQDPKPIFVKSSMLEKESALEKIEDDLINFLDLHRCLYLSHLRSMIYLSLYRSFSRDSRMLSSLTDRMVAHLTETGAVYLQDSLVLRGDSLEQNWKKTDCTPLESLSIWFQIYHHAKSGLPSNRFAAGFVRNPYETLLFFQGKKIYSVCPLPWQSLYADRLDYLRSSQRILFADERRKLILNPELRTLLYESTSDISQIYLLRTDRQYGYLKKLLSENSPDIFDAKLNRFYVLEDAYLKQRYPIPKFKSLN